MVIGVVGTLASGKDTVAQYLEQLGFAHFSTADEVRRQMEAHNLPLDRDSMTAFARQQRAEHGNAYFTERVIERFPTDESTMVVADMRHPDEIEALRKIPHFFLISVDAPIGLRFARARERGRVGDGETLADFQAKEERELSGKLASHNLGSVIKMADYHICNDATLEDLHQKVDNILQRIQNLEDSLPRRQAGS